MRNREVRIIPFIVRTKCTSLKIPWSLIHTLQHHHFLQHRLSQQYLFHPLLHIHPFSCLFYLLCLYSIWNQIWRVLMLIFHHNWNYFDSTNVYRETFICTLFDLKPMSLCKNVVKNVFINVFSSFTLIHNSCIILIKLTVIILFRSAKE